MKKSLALILTLSLLGCSTTQPEPTPTPTIATTQLPTMEPTIEPTAEPSSYKITDVQFVCGLSFTDGYSFNEDNTVVQGFGEFTDTYYKGTYTQIDDTIYEITNPISNSNPKLNTKEYFIFDSETGAAYSYFDDSFTLDELRNYSASTPFSGIHGCVTYGPEAFPDTIYSTHDYNITELDFTCGEENIAYNFEADTQTFEKVSSTLSRNGTYTQITDVLYELQFEGTAEKEYFFYEIENYYSFALLNSPISTEELVEIPNLQLNHGCEARIYSDQLRYNVIFDEVPRNSKTVPFDIMITKLSSE